MGHQHQELIEPGREWWARPSVAVSRAADWDSGDQGAIPGHAMINELHDLGKLISLDIRGMIWKLHAVLSS